MGPTPTDRARELARRHGLTVVGLLLPIAWVFRGVFRGETYALSWWYAYDPLFAAARDFETPARAPTIWDPSPSALNAVADRFSAESLSRFELPLWNPYHALGMPLLAEVHPVVLSPLRWLVSFPLGGGDVGTTALMITQLALATFGAYGWLRSCDRTREAALVAGAAYPFVGGAIAALHFTTTAGMTSLPFMLWAGERLVRAPSLGAAARFGLAAAFAAFVTHPSVAFMCGVGTALYVFVRALGRRERTGDVLALSVLAAAITTGLASILLLPFRELMAHGWTYKQVVGPDDVHTDVFWHFLLPPLASVTFFPIALAALGALGLFSKTRERWALVTMFVIAFGLVYEVPGSRLLAHIPFQAVFGRAYIVLVACGAATGLFARALDMLAQEKRRRFWLVGACAALIVAAFVGLRVGGSLPIDEWTRLEQWTAPDGARVAAGLVLVLGLAALAAMPEALRRAWVYRFVYLCLFLEIVPRAAAHIQPEPRFDFPTTPALSYLQEHLDAGERVISVGTWASHTNLTAHVPNVGLVTHVHDIRCADPLFVDRTHALLDPLSARSWYAIHFWHYPEPRGRRTASDRLPTILEMLGVRYALDRPGGAMPPGHREAYRDDTLVIYENPRAFDRAFIVHELEHVASVDNALSRIHEVDLSRVVVLDGPEPAPLPSSSASHGGESVRIANLEPQRVVLEAALESEGYVVYTDAFFPGWSATLDGAPVDIVPANVAVRAIRVPAGSHRIEMRYAPSSVRTGLWLALAALALALALLVRERLIEAKRPSLPTPPPEPPSSPR